MRLKTGTPCSHNLWLMTLKWNLQYTQLPAELAESHKLQLVTHKSSGQCTLFSGERAFARQLPGRKQSKAGKLLPQSRSCRQRGQLVSDDASQTNAHPNPPGWSRIQGTHPEKLSCFKFANPGSRNLWAGGIQILWQGVQGFGCTPCPRWGMLEELGKVFSRTCCCLWWVLRWL